MTNTELHISTHETDPALFAALARVFEVREHGTSKWVEISTDGVRLTFFAPHPVNVDPLDALAETLSA